MIQKIMLQVEIDNSQLDLTQAKVDKLTRSLEFAERMLSQKKWFDDKAVDDAQAKADKLVATLERMEQLIKVIWKIDQFLDKPVIKKGDVTDDDLHNLKATPNKGTPNAKDIPNADLRDAELSFQRLCKALLNIHYA